MSDPVLTATEQIRRTIVEYGQFIIHGGHVDVTDGRCVYMRAPVAEANGPLHEHTLMPTHMRSRFAVAELMSWEAAEPVHLHQGPAHYGLGNNATRGVRRWAVPGTAGSVRWARSVSRG